MTRGDTCQFWTCVYSYEVVAMFLQIFQINSNRNAVVKLQPKFNLNNMCSHTDKFSVATCCGILMHQIQLDKTLQTDWPYWKKTPHMHTRNIWALNWALQLCKLFHASCAVVDGRKEAEPTEKFWWFIGQFWEFCERCPTNGRQMKQRRVDLTWYIVLVLPVEQKSLMHRDQSITMQTLYLTLAAIFCGFVSSLEKHGSITFYVPASGKTCFYETMQEVKAREFHFGVTQGGNFDIDLEIRYPSGKLLHHATKQTKGELPFTSSERGDYEFCFSNQFSSWTQKTVSMALEDAAIDSLAEEAGDADADAPTVHTLMQTSLENMHRSNSKVHAYQREFRLKELRSKSVSSDLNRRVLWWSAGQAALIVLVSMSQVFILRNFFTEKRRIHPVHNLGGTPL